MARPRKPTKVLEMNGAFKQNPQRRAARVAEVQTDLPIGAPPAWLGEHGLRKWRELSADATYGPILNAHNRLAFEHLCVLYDRFVNDAMGNQDMKVTDRQQFGSLLMQFGLTPASSSKVIAPQPKEAASGWDKVSNR